MKRIRTTADVNRPTLWIAAGTETEVSDEFAAELIASGEAEEVKAKPAPKQPVRKRK